MLGTGQQAVLREEAGIRTGQVTGLLPDCQAQVPRILLSIGPQSPLPLLTLRVAATPASFRVSAVPSAWNALPSTTGIVVHAHTRTLTHMHTI